jgi:hypothetical protein
MNLKQIEINNLNHKIIRLGHMNEGLIASV